MRVHLVIDNIRSAYNVGSIFRTADGAGIDKIHICGYSPTPKNQKVLKTSLGSEKSVLWEYYESITDCIRQLKEDGFLVLAVEVHDKAINYNEYEYRSDTALILGNEKSGISNEILSLCDDTIMIEMNGKKTSLNVAVTAGIISYSVIHMIKNKK